jgi:predicted patatin/cPLA2 family phospholipase
MGYRKNVVVLTRPEGYRKEPDNLIKLEAIIYRDYPDFIKREYMRHLYYNKTLDKLKELEDKGEVLIIRPSKTVDISRTEKDEKKIREMYELGVQDAENLLDRIKSFLAK